MEFSTLKPSLARRVGAQLEYPKKPTVCVTHRTVSRRVGPRYFFCSSNLNGALVLVACADSTGAAGAASGPFSAATRASISVRAASALSYWPLLSYQRGDSFR